MADQARPAERHSLILPILAVGLYVPLFIFRATGPLDFWASLSLSAVFLSVAALGADRTYYPLLREDLRARPMFKIMLGLLSALALYGIFWVGNLLLRRIFPAAGPDIHGIYGFGAGVARLRIILLILFFIGPGEELFWRGYLQRSWKSRFSGKASWLLTTLLYAGVHLGSANPVLVLAAAVCGFFWGFVFLRFRSPLMVCVSHTVWDLLAFVILPFS